MARPAYLSSGVRHAAAGLHGDDRRQFSQFARDWYDGYPNDAYGRAEPASVERAFKLNKVDMTVLTVITEDAEDAEDAEFRDRMGWFDCCDLGAACSEPSSALSTAPPAPRYRHRMPWPDKTPALPLFG